MSLFFLSCLFGSVGVSILTNLFMEAYWQRRATEEIHDHDRGLE